MSHEFGSKLRQHFRIVIAQIAPKRLEREPKGKLSIVTSLAPLGLKIVDLTAHFELLLGHLSVCTRAMLKVLVDAGGLKTYWWVFWQPTNNASANQLSFCALGLGLLLHHLPEATFGT
jgi:hypothetical protein